MSALQRHRLRFGLPALLQRLDGVDAQHRLRAQLGGFRDHGLAALDAGLLLNLEGRARRAEGGVPLGLQLGEHLLAYMARVAPAIGELVQRTVVGLEVGVADLRLGPGLHLLDQRQALGTVLGRIGPHLLEPGLDHLVGFVAGLVEALPQRVVGHLSLIHI